MIWQEKVVLSSQDADINSVIGAGAVMRIMEESAEHQVRYFGPSSEALRAEGKAFLLSRFSLDYLCPLRPNDEATVETWGCPSRGFGFLRCYRIKIGDKTMAKGQARLALINIADRRLLRVSDYACGFEPDEPFSPLLDDRIPREETENEIGTHAVRYADCDLNGHLNNTRYADMFCGFLPMRGCRVKTLCISYLREAPMGTTLSVKSKETSSGFLLRSQLPDLQTNSEALITIVQL